MLRRRPARDRLAGASPHDPRSVGEYLTDGAGLFRVVHAIEDARGKTTLLELEDCRTLQLVLCEAETLSRSQMQAVTPASFESGDASCEPLADHAARHICSPGAPAPPFAGLQTG